LWYKSLPPIRKHELELNRYLYNGYVTFLKKTGKFDTELEILIQQPKKSLQNKESCFETKVANTILAIKSRDIP